MPAFEDKIPFYDRRRPLESPIGLARDVVNREIIDPDLKVLLSHKAVEQLAQTDDMPLPAAADREGYYGDRHLEYWLSGYDDCSKLEGRLESNSGSSLPLKCLDFGGCTGRVARHLSRNARHETWLCDINATYIDWLERYSTRPIRSFQNRPFPSLPFESNTFDLISAFSVFTHIAEGELHWILELKRIIRPGGILYLTVLDDSTWAIARSQEWLINSFARGTEDARLRRDISGDIPSDRYILRYSTADAYNCNVFYKREFLRERWVSHFANGEFVSQGHAYQSCLILRK